jgi:hypothetical protein
VPRYVTIPPIVVPDTVLRHAVEVAEQQASALGLYRRPVLVWIDDAHMVGRFPGAWESTRHEWDRAVRGFYLGASDVGVPERIYVHARGDLANILRTIAHEIRHVAQARGLCTGGVAWVDGKWADVTKREGSELDAHAYAARAVQVAPWMKTYLVAPVYDAGSQSDLQRRRERLQRHRSA